MQKQVFQNYYVSTLARSPSDISWVGSFQTWLLFAVGAIAGRATDAGYFKLVFAIGSTLQVLGLFMISLCNTYWQFFLAQGLCQGLGVGFIFIPVLSILPAYFSSHRLVAMALAATGTATGGMIYPAIIESLLPRIGFQWTIRVIGFIMLACQIVCFCFLKQRTLPRKSGPLVEWSAFRDATYTLVAVGVFCINWGVWFAFYYIPSYSSSVLHTSSATSTNLLLIINGVGIPGRIVPGFLADRYIGPLNMLIFFSCIGGFTLLSWAAVSSLPDLTAWAVIYGVASAGFLGLFPATLSTLTDDPRKTGTRMGMVFSIMSFACLTGPPIGGTLILRMNGSYFGAQIFAGSAVIVGSLAIMAARISKKGWVLWVKA